MVGEGWLNFTQLSDAWGAWGVGSIQLDPEIRAGAEGTGGGGGGGTCAAGGCEI